jgi:mannose-1-phosphate guanylyltransferase / phosphomannomutase
LKTVIMAGGKGTRMTSVSGTIPKGLLKVDGKPVLAHQIECLASQGYRDIIVVTGHLGDAIQDRLGDGSTLGVRISYCHEDKPLGTAGALVALKEKLNDDFLLINGDLIFDIDFKRFQAFHHDMNALATLFTHPNNHPFDSAIVIAGNDARVTGWLSASDKRPACKNRVNAGIHIISPLLLADKNKVGKLDLDTGIIIPALDSGRIYAYDSPEYVKDMGTPKRYKEVCEDYTAGRVHAKNLSIKQKAVFLDRDGTINEYKGLVTKPEYLNLIEGSAQAVAKINSSGYLAILITNQPVIARGDCTVEELEQIHNRLEHLLGEQGAYLDAIYYCPHHPDEGFMGEKLEYKINCECRKPKPGMILQAAKKYNVDLRESFMVGDDIKDIAAGKAAGCKTAFLLSGKPPNGPVHATVYKDLLEFVRLNI